jgi:hypothetical protein
MGPRQGERGAREAFVRRARASSVARFGWPIPFLGSIVAAVGAPAHASDDAVARAVAPGEPVAIGRVLEAGPGPPALFFLTGAGYGYTESVLGLGDSHDRLGARLIVDGRPRPWLELTLRLDGRYDWHSIPQQGFDDGYVFDPRIQARVDRALGGGLSVAARAGVWLPAADVPSVRLAALSPELVGAVTYASARVPLSISANAGYRLDRSARTATDAAQLSASDHLALGLNAFDAVLLGAAASFGRRRVSGFVEASWELLVGAGHPPPLTSPMFIGAGVRAAVAPRLRVEAGAELSPSRRPDLAVTAPLVAVPPRVAVWLGLAYRFDALSAREPLAQPEPPRAAPPAVPAAVAGAATAAATEPPAPPPPPEAEMRPPSGQLRGLVRSLRGSPVDADIVIRQAKRPAEEGQRLAAAGGLFTADVVPGSYEVVIEAPGFEPQRRRVQVEENGVTLLNVDLKVAR